MAREIKRSAVFHPEFREDLRHWVKSDRNVAVRVLDLVEPWCATHFRAPASLSRFDTSSRAAGRDESHKNTVSFIALAMSVSISFRLATTIEPLCQDQNVYSGTPGAGNGSASGSPSPAATGTATG